MRGNTLSEWLKKKKTKQGVKPSISSLPSLMMIDAPGSDDMTMPSQLLHKELGHSFPRICSSDPQRQHCSLLTNVQLLLLIQNLWPLMEGYQHLVPTRAHRTTTWPVPPKASSLERAKKKKIKIKKWLPLGRRCCVSIPKCLGCQRQRWGHAAEDLLVGLPLVGGGHPGIRTRAPGQCFVPDPQWEARTETMVGGVWQRTWGKKKSSLCSNCTGYFTVAAPTCRWCRNREHGWKDHTHQGDHPRQNQ